MGSASPHEPLKDMEGYYNLLQAGSELESTLQREYIFTYVFKTTTFTLGELESVLCSIARIMYAIYSFGHNLDLIFDNLLERCARFNLSVKPCIGNLMD